jgi:transcriptional regulator with XRE-family HTH domain
MKADEQIISKWLSRELKDRGMSAGELAEKTGIGRATMYYYASGERIPSPEQAQKIGAALGAVVPEYKMRPEGRPRPRQ